MSNYKVTEKDLIGCLNGFPIEVVEKMLEKQQTQKGYVNISILQDSICGAFRWCGTSEGHKFWEDVILRKDFSLFFEKYPKKHIYVYIYQDGTKDIEGVINTLIRYGGVNSLRLNGNSTGSIYYISPDNNVIRVARPLDPTITFIKTFYTEIQPESSVVEYTIQEIADKLGIKVDELRIKK